MRVCTLQVGDIVNVDVTAYYKGYHGDLNETFVVGEVDEESKKLTKVAYEVQIRHHLPPCMQMPRFHIMNALRAKCRWPDGSDTRVLMTTCASHSA
jgi:Metallopeptidase family M24